MEKVLTEIAESGDGKNDATAAPAAAAAAAALAAVASATASAASAAASSPPPSGRGEWVYFTVPRRPVAGGRVAVFYNLSNASGGGDALRASGAGNDGGVSLRLHARCNGWSLPLAAASGASDHFPLPNSASPASDNSGSWHVTALDLPAEAFELEFVVEAVRGGGTEKTRRSSLSTTLPATISSSLSPPR